jgi:hypothetical protein
MQSTATGISFVSTETVRAVKLAVKLAALKNYEAHGAKPANSTGLDTRGGWWNASNLSHFREPQEAKSSLNPTFANILASVSPAFFAWPLFQRFEIDPP